MQVCKFTAGDQKTKLFAYKLTLRREFIHSRFGFNFGSLYLLLWFSLCLGFCVAHVFSVIPFFVISLCKRILQNDCRGKTQEASFEYMRYNVKLTFTFDNNGNPDTACYMQSNHFQSGPEWYAFY